MERVSSAGSSGSINGTISVDINEEIPGCEDNYYRFILCFWRISIGWISLFSLFCNVASLSIQGLGSMSNLSDETKQKIGLTAIIVTAVSVALGLIRQHAETAISERTKTLKQLIAEYNRLKSV